jgi:hypothetical protein
MGHPGLVAGALCSGSNMGTPGLIQADLPRLQARGQALSPGGSVMDTFFGQRYQRKKSTQGKAPASG